MASQICRLCLKIINSNNFEIIEQVIRENLQKLVLNLNLDISEEPVICDDCANKLQKCVDFKSICYYPLLFTNSDKGVTTNSNEICLRNSETVKIADISISQETCYFCQKCIGREFSEFSKDSKENVFIMNELKIHIPEVNFTVGDGTLTCAGCFDSIQNLYTFKLNCLNVEQRIEKYVEMEGRDDKNQINLNNVLTHTFTSTIKYEVNSAHCVVPKIEDMNYELIKNKYLKCITMKDREDGQQMESNYIPKTKETDSDIMENVTVKTEIVDENLNGDENIFNSVLSLKNEEIEIKSEDCESFQDIALEPNNTKISDINAEIYSKLSPPMVVQTNENPVNSDAPHRCNLCFFETKYKSSLTHHMITHKNLSDVEVYSCDKCSYKTKYKNNLKLHMLVHKNPSEINMFKCKLCSYEAKRKDNLTKHMVMHHKNPLEISMSKCSLSDIKVYTCDTCSYKSKRKRNLDDHMLVHKNPSEINMFKSKLCSYEAKRKNNLTKHLVMHKDPSKISMFKCSLCTYEAKFNSDLKNHMISHKDVSEVEMYKCQTCIFETKRKHYLKTHMRIHQLESELRMYTCDICPFKTRHRYSLNQHELTHKDFSEVTVFTCHVCSYQTRFKRNLPMHMLSHKNPSEVTMYKYKCELCPYKARHRNYLNLHALIHQSPSDIMMYQCDMCTYQTKRKIHLKLHMVTHKKSAKVQHT